MNIRFPFFRFLILAVSITSLMSGCYSQTTGTQPLRDLPEAAVVFIYPIGESDAVTERRDGSDSWYNAQDFRENDHLGEDWNLNSGGNSDCGKRVRAVGNGKIAFAGDAGPGWGNVVIVTHYLSNGSQIQSLYGHLRSIAKTEGRVKIGEELGTVGDGGGRYLCHLHFEIRTRSCPQWDKPGPGYLDVSEGWIDPSDFIDKNLRVTPR